MKWFNLIENAGSVPESLGVSDERAKQLADKVAELLGGEWNMRHQAKDIATISEWVTNPQELALACYVYGCRLSDIRSADEHLKHAYNPN